MLRESEQKLCTTGGWCDDDGLLVFGIIVQSAVLIEFQISKLGGCGCERRRKTIRFRFTFEDFSVSCAPLAAPPRDLFDVRAAHAP